MIPRLLSILKQIFLVIMIIVCLEFELGKQSGVFRLCGSLNDSDHVYHLQETTALLYPKSFHIFVWKSTYLSKRKHWILRIGVVGRCKKCQNLTFIRILLNSFLLKNANLGAHFLLWITWLQKRNPIFDSFLLHQF